MNGFIKLIKDLHEHGKNNENNVLLVLYVVNLLFIFVDLVYLGFFFNVKSFMWIVSIFWFIINVNSFYTLKKRKIALFIKIMFIEIYAYFVSAVLLTGWDYGFQVYIYAIICSFFLPFYLPDKKERNKKYQIFMGVFFISTYFVLQGIVIHFDLWDVVKTSDVFKQIVYGLNSLISMFGIVLFSVFSSRIALESNRKLSRRADFDELTQIYNRYSLNTIINNYINIKSLNMFNLAILDIDFFKRVNDTYGHNVGDEVLKYVANILKRIDSIDIDVGRWGGEEFLIISKNSLTYNEFKNQLEDVRKYIEKHPYEYGEISIFLTVSIGLTMYKKGDDIKTLVKKADDNLYIAKSSGRNKIIG